MTSADLYRALWRRKLLIGLLTAGCVGVTLFVSLSQTPVYEAETLIRIQQRIDDSSQAFESLEASQRLAETYAEIIETGALADRVERLARGAPGVTVSQEALSARPVEDLELLTISARNSDPRLAGLVANAVPDALRNFIRETGTLRDSIVTVAPATTPTSPSSPNLPLNLALALLLGLVVNAAIALLVELLADRLPDVEELEDSLGLPVLATVPALDFPRSPRRPLSHRLLGGRADRDAEVGPPEGSRVG
jgi:capsular polysaccharide biosynthesis protein